MNLSRKPCWLRVTVLIIPDVSDCMAWTYLLPSISSKHTPRTPSSYPDRLSLQTLLHGVPQNRGVEKCRSIFVYNMKWNDLIFLLQRKLLLILILACCVCFMDILYWDIKRVLSITSNPFPLSVSNFISKIAGSVS